jgi:hypothetical protein
MTNRVDYTEKDGFTTEFGIKYTQKMPWWFEK